MNCDSEKLEVVLLIELVLEKPKVTSPEAFLGLRSPS
jgi:hypothetical protein